MKVKANIGSFDGGARFILGCTILFFSVNGLGWWAMLGLIPIATAACRFCPLYRLLHIDTAAWEEDYERHHRPPNAQ